MVLTHVVVSTAGFQHLCDRLLGRFRLSGKNIEVELGDGETVPAIPLVHELELLVARHDRAERDEGVIAHHDLRDRSPCEVSALWFSGCGRLCRGWALAWPSPVGVVPSFPAQAAVNTSGKKTSDASLVMDLILLATDSGLTLRQGQVF